jgi:hypothetical protein
MIGRREFAARRCGLFLDGEGNGRERGRHAQQHQKHPVRQRLDHLRLTRSSLFFRHLTDQSVSRSATSTTGARANARALNLACRGAIQVIARQIIGLPIGARSL